MLMICILSGPEGGDDDDDDDGDDDNGKEAEGQGKMQRKKNFLLKENLVYNLENITILQIYKNINIYYFRINISA